MSKALCLGFFTYLFILQVVSARYDKLPEGSLFKDAKVISHRQHVCLVVPSDPKCLKIDQPTGSDLDVSQFYDIRKYTGRTNVAPYYIKP